MRATGSVAQQPKGGGWRSPLGLDALQAAIRERPDGTATELCRVYNRRVGQVEQTTQTSFPRAMRRVGYVLEKRLRLNKIDRPDVWAKRAVFLRWVRCINPQRLAFVDEAAAKIVMGRSHAGVQHGEEYVDA